MATNEVTEQPVGTRVPRLAGRPITPRLVAMILYGAAAVIAIGVVGVPLDREQVLLWIVGALVISCIGRSRRGLLGIVRDWIPFAVLLVAYDYSRGAADTLGMPLRVGEMISFDRLIGAGEVPTAWLQEHLFDPAQRHWYDVVATLVHGSHFFAVYVIAAVLWVRNRARWVAFVSRLMVLTFAGLATYVLFPAAPPWYAGDRGLIGPVQRFIGEGWSAMGLDRAASLLDKGQAVANQVAAVPSLHAAFAAFICAFFWRGARWPTRIILGLYPIAMAFTLVYSAEHYVFDVLLGWVYVALTMVTVGRLERWRSTRHGLLPPPMPDGTSTSVGAST